MIPSITPAELNDRMQDSSPTLLDVREPLEVGLCRLEGIVHIPLNRLRVEAEARLSKDREIVVYCHHGSRSLIGAQMLRALGYPSVINLEGGIDRWSLEVDPSVARY